MKCRSCGAETAAEDAYEHGGKTLCEDCYMDIMARPKTCDPWAVHRAKSTARLGGDQLNETQQRILDHLEATGGAGFDELAAALGLDAAALEREMAVLRHFEKLRAQMRDGKKVIVPW